MLDNDFPRNVALIESIQSVDMLSHPPSFPRNVIVSLITS